MKTASAIVLLVLMVSVQTPILQVFKVPALIGHFNKHQQDETVTLIGFLNDHYSPNHNDADLPEDQQLPFKSITLFTMGFAIVPGFIKTTIFVPVVSDNRPAFNGTYSPQMHLTNIFHPPRV